MEDATTSLFPDSIVSQELPTVPAPLAAQTPATMDMDGEPAGSTVTPTTPTTINILVHIQCLGCGQWLPLPSLLASLPAESVPQTLPVGDDFYYYNPHYRPCSEQCTLRLQQAQPTVGALVPETPLLRMQLTWTDIVHLALFSAQHTKPSPRIDQHRHFYSFKQDICQFVQTNWKRLWTKSFTDSWTNTVGHVLGGNKNRFLSGRTDAKMQAVGWWALVEPQRLPSSYEASNPKKGRPAAYQVLPDGTLGKCLLPGGDKDNNKEGAASSQKRSASSTKNSATLPTASKKVKVDAGVASTASATTTSGGATNAADPPRKKKPKRNAKKVDARASCTMYRDLPNPRELVRLSRQPTHSAPQCKISEDGLSMHNEKGYRLAKGSHGASVGSWYFEVTVMPPLTPKGNLRIGWSQISGDLQGPCGFDGFGYSFRADPPTVFHASRGRAYGESYRPGDVLGVFISLPQLEEGAPLTAEPLQQQVAVVSPTGSAETPASTPVTPVPVPCDLLPEPWRPGMPYQAVTYYGPRPIHPGSQIRYFVNGRDQGVAFENLYLGKYHPCISSYMGGLATVNFGNQEWKYWKEMVEVVGSQEVRPISDLYAMAMAEAEAEAVPEEPAAVEMEVVVEIEVGEVPDSTAGDSLNAGVKENSRPREEPIFPEEPKENNAEQGDLLPEENAQAPEVSTFVKSPVTTTNEDLDSAERVKE